MFEGSIKFERNSQETSFSKLHKFYFGTYEYCSERWVADNLRSNFFYKDHCSRNNIDAVLISLC
jgi:hypothetical protein